MKILYIINSLKNGGPVNMLYTLVKYIDKSRFDITVLALKKCDKDNERKFDDINCNVITIEEKRIYSKIIKVQKKVDEIKPDIIHSHGGVADMVNSRIKGNHVSFSTVHCNPYEDFVMKKGIIEGWIRANAFIRTLKKIDHPIACSETVSDNIKKKCKMDLEFVRNGIDIDKIVEHEQICREELGIKQDDIIYVFCGYLSKRKNVSFLIDSLKKTHRQNIVLLIIGDGTEYEVLKDKASDDKRIIFVGRSAFPTKYLNISDFFISSSLSEGLPMAVMEGMGCGLPAVLSDIDSHQEMKKCCGDIVQLFDLESEDQLVEIFEKNKIDNNKKEMARNVILSYLNASRMANEYMGLYEKNRNK